MHVQTVDTRPLTMLTSCGEIIGAGRVGGTWGMVALLGENLPHTADTRFNLLGVVTCVTSFTVSNH